MNRERDFESAMARFFHGLRGAGLPLTIGESIQAMESMNYIDVGNREQFRAALRCLLVKEPGHMPVFERVFEYFFAAPRIKKHLHQRVETGREQERVALAESDQDLRFQGKPLDLPPEDKLLYGNLSEEEKERVREFLKKSSAGKNVGSEFQPIIERLVQGQLAAWRRQLDNPIDFQLEESGDPELDDIWQELANDPVATGLLQKDLKHLGEKELVKMSQIVEEITRKLASTLSRRTRQAQHAKKIDVRRTIRKNLGFGGVLLRLAYKQKRADRPKVLLLCDVSGSMARYARFLLQFMYSLTSVVNSIDSFIFAEKLEPVNHYFTKQQSFETVMGRLMSESKTWGQATRMDLALETLVNRYSKVIHPRTRVIILSDGKTLQPETVAAYLKRIRVRCKGILWLNTTPKREWAGKKSVEMFSRESQMVECYTMEHLRSVLLRHLL